MTKIVLDTKKYLRTTDYANYLSDKFGKQILAQHVNNWRRRGKIVPKFFEGFKEPFFDINQKVQVIGYDKL